MNENELTTEVASLAETVMALRVTDATSYKAASDVLLQAKDMQKRIVAYFKPLKESAFAAHKAVTAKEGSELAKIAPVEAHLKKQIGDYAAEQERLRKIEQARLDAIRAYDGECALFRHLEKCHDYTSRENGMYRRGHPILVLPCAGLRSTVVRWRLRRGPESRPGTDLCL